MEKSLKIVAWIIVWVVFTIGFVEYLPQDGHNILSVLMSPILLPFDLFSAVFYRPKLSIDSFHVEMLFGFIFWVVVFLLFYFPRNRNNTM
ncbi:hypothetical protein MNBD_GAMMA07-599 [hydrothermal vent metagenome]|uniref:Uncharacterized protein n=1 Tax=hydrothermal vent metagenome TaxID=652676 RepID=A0A3B0X4H4_9ZZZZ